LFLYGDVDWCPISHALDLKELSPENVEIETVSDSGHMIQTDNFNELSEKIFVYLKREGILNEEEVSSDTLSFGEEEQVKV